MCECVRGGSAKISLLQKLTFGGVCAELKQEKQRARTGDLESYGCQTWWRAEDI